MTKNTKLNVIRVALLAIGLVVGCWHCFLALQSILVMRDEWVLLAAIFFGPLSTLPAIVFGLFRPRVAGWWLIVGSLIFISLSISSGKMDAYQIRNGLGWFVVPMALMGAALLFEARYITLRLAEIQSTWWAGNKSRLPRP